MSYYILPKTNNIINIKPILDQNIVNTYTSHSLFNYHKELYSQLQKLCNDNCETIDSVLKLINPCEYIFSKVPGSKYSVSKLKPKSNIFYDFMEISNNSNIFDNYKNSNIKSLHVTPNCIDTIYCYELLREGYYDDVVYFSDTCQQLYETVYKEKYDFIFFEIEETNFNNLNTYVLKLLEFLKIILKWFYLHILN